MSKVHSYDAIVVGGGHNGLVNAAYLAKAGLKTIVLERRHLVGGAAITEELIPGFKFTTFSYALSLLRPEIVQDLELVSHGFMVLPLGNTFQPGYNGEYLALGSDPDANYHEIARHSIEDAEAAQDLNHLISRMARAIKPWMDRIVINCPKCNNDLTSGNNKQFEGLVDTISTRSPEPPHGQTANQGLHTIGKDVRLANEMAQNLRRLGDRTHGMDNAQHRRDNAKGGKCLAHISHRVGDIVILGMMGF